jgi:hypothetical protein
MGTLDIAISVYGPKAQALAVKEASIRASKSNWLEQMKKRSAGPRNAGNAEYNCGRNSLRFASGHSRYLI